MSQILSFSPSLTFAQQLDRSDPLHSFRSRFFLPRNEFSESIYLCGNSLGLQPRQARVYVQEELEKWSAVGVEGHFTGLRPWAKIDERVVELSAELVGAKYEEVVVMNSLSVNLHLMMVAFYRPDAKRFKIVMEDFAFCSDSHVVASQIKLHNRTVDECLICVKPRAGEDCIRHEDIVKTLQEHGESISLVLFAGVQFYTGQVFSLENIVKEAHKFGIKVGLDLAHAVGNIELKLHDWEVDFACWCSYKYLNAGPGGIGGCFVHEKYAHADFIRLAGWWGQESDVRFMMNPVHEPKPGAQGFQLSNPSVLNTVCLLASLELFSEAKMFMLRAKSEYGLP